MPASLKFFFLLCTAITAWFIWQGASALWFPSPEFAAYLATLPENYRALAKAGQHFTGVTYLLQGVVLFAFAALITFGRMGWMRYLLAGLIVFQYAVPSVVALTQSARPFAERWASYAHARWHSPADFLWLDVWVLVIVTMFWNSRRWFRRYRA